MHCVTSAFCSDTALFGFITLIGNVFVLRQFLDPTPRSDSDAIMVNERLWRASQPVRYGSSLDGKFGWKADISEIVTSPISSCRIFAERQTFALSPITR